VFDLQLEIAKDVADKIEVLIKPEEELQINKLPTENAEAYDLFLKGLDLMYRGGQENLDKIDRFINVFIRLIQEP